MSRRRQQTASARISGGVQDARGVRGRACGHSSVRNRRDPSRRPTLGVGGPYKPTVKGDRAGRESEGLIVLTTSATRTPVEGRSPALVMLVQGGKREGMVARPNHPRGTTMDKARELQRSLGKVAKCQRDCRFRPLYAKPWQSDVLPGASKRRLPGGTHAPCADHR